MLYLRRAELSRLAPAMRRIHAAVAGHLAPGTPALAFPLAIGVAAADDPGSHGQSFGSSRCAALAEGLLLARSAGAITLTERLDVVLAHLVDQGIRPDRPYLADGTDDPYPALREDLR